MSHRLDVLEFSSKSWSIRSVSAAKKRQTEDESSKRKCLASKHCNSKSKNASKLSKTRRTLTRKDLGKKRRLACSKLRRNQKREELHLKKKAVERRSKKNFEPERKKSAS